MPQTTGAAVMKRGGAGVYALFILHIFWRIKMILDNHASQASFRPLLNAEDTSVLRVSER